MTATTVIEFLQEMHPDGISATAIVARLQARGTTITRAEANIALYKAQRKCECVSDGGTPPIWTWLAPEAKVARESASRPRVARGSASRPRVARESTPAIRAALRRCTEALADLTRLIEALEDSEDSEALPRRIEDVPAVSKDSEASEDSEK